MNRKYVEAMAQASWEATHITPWDDSEYERDRAREMLAALIATLRTDPQAVEATGADEHTIRWLCDYLERDD